MKIVRFPQLRKNKWQGQESVTLFMNSSPGCKNKSGCKYYHYLSVHLFLTIIWLRPHINHHRQTSLSHCFSSLCLNQWVMLMISSFCRALLLLFQHIRGVFCSEWFQQDFSSSLASEKHWMAAAREGPGWRRFLLDTAVFFGFSAN